jgi:hypothetical protein
LELHFFIGDQVLLGGRERDRVTIFIGRGGHSCCSFCDVKFQFL